MLQSLLQVAEDQFQYACTNGSLDPVGNLHKGGRESSVHSPRHPGHLRQS